MPDFSELSDADLQKRLNQIYQMIQRGSNSSVATQLLMILDSLRAEQQRRSEQQLTQTLGQDLDNIINIG